MDTEFEMLLYGQQFKKLYEKMSNLITEKYGLHKVEIEILLFLKKAKGIRLGTLQKTNIFQKRISPMQLISLWNADIWWANRMRRIGDASI